MVEIFRESMELSYGYYLETNPSFHMRKKTLHCLCYHFLPGNDGSEISAQAIKFNATRQLNQKSTNVHSLLAISMARALFRMKKCPYFTQTAREYFGYAFRLEKMSFEIQPFNLEIWSTLVVPSLRHKRDIEYFKFR